MKTERRICRRADPPGTADQYYSFVSEQGFKVERPLLPDVKHQTPDYFCAAARGILFITIFCSSFAPLVFAVSSAQVISNSSVVFRFHALLLFTWTVPLRTSVKYRKYNSIQCDRHLFASPMLRVILAHVPESYVFIWLSRGMDLRREAMTISSLAQAAEFFYCHRLEILFLARPTSWLHGPWFDRSVAERQEVTKVTYLGITGIILA